MYIFLRVHRYSYLVTSNYTFTLLPTHGHLSGYSWVTSWLAGCGFTIDIHAFRSMYTISSHLRQSSWRLLVLKHFPQPGHRGLLSSFLIEGQGEAATLLLWLAAASAVVMVVVILLATVFVVVAPSDHICSVFTLLLVVDWSLPWFWGDGLWCVVFSQIS